MHSTLNKDTFKLISRASVKLLTLVGQKQLSSDIDILANFEFKYVFRANQQ